LSGGPSGRRFAFAERRHALAQVKPLEGRGLHDVHISIRLDAVGKLVLCKGQELVLVLALMEHRECRELDRGSLAVGQDCRRDLPEGAGRVDDGHDGLECA